MESAILFWTQVGAVGQLMGAVATTAAVIVSLWVVASERRPHIKVQAGMRMIVGGGEPATDIVAISVSNHGLRTVSITSFGWRTGWISGLGPRWAKFQWAQQNPEARSDPLIGHVQPPFDLAPGEERTIMLRAETYRRNNDQVKQRNFFGRKLPFQKEVSPANVCVVVSLAVFKSVITPVERPLARFLVTGEVEGGAQRFNDITDAP
jgi:hypothetical protein